MSLLSITNLSVAIHRFNILQGVTLWVDAGEIVAVTGESGSGKSMTALAAMQLLPKGTQARGHIMLGDQDLLALPEAELCAIRGNDIGMVFQEPMTALNPVQTIGHQVAETIRIHDKTVSRHAAARQAAETLERVGLPNDRFPLSRYPHELSGGQRQQVAVGRALMTQPKVLMLDEPTAGVSPIVMDELFDRIIEVARTGIPILMVEQNARQALEIADKGYVLVQGANAFTGTGKELLEDPEVRKSFLGG